MLATWGTSTGRNPTLDLQFAGATSLDNRITFSRGSQATLFDSTGALVYAKHNLVVQSQTFQTTWTVANAVISADVGTAPDGTSTADLLYPLTTGTFRIVFQGGATADIPWTISVYAKALGMTWLALGTNTNTADCAWFNLATGAVGTKGANITSHSISAMGNGWYRCIVTFTASVARSLMIAVVDGDNTSTATASGTNGILIWGGQLNATAMEGGVTSSLSTYYPTVASAYYAPRFDYNPSTLAAQGLLIEEQRTNSIRNNTMQGAVAGTPGTVPTNWSTFTTLTGLTRTIVGAGTENGVTYVDIRLNGTPSAAGIYGIYFEGSTQVAAANGQNWTSSAYIKLAGGSLTGISTVNYVVAELNNVGGFLASSTTAATPTGSALSTQRTVVSRTFNQATTAFALPYIDLVLSGAAIDITLRIGLPQLEQGAFATSVIPTTTTALTRSADVASMTGTNFSSWFNATAGTLYTETVVSRQIAAAGTGFAGFDDTTANNTIRNFGRAAGSTGFIVSVGGVTQADLTPTGVLSANTIAKIASAYALNDFATTGNGGAVQIDTSGTIPSVTRMLLGFDVSTGNYLNGWIRKVSYYPVRLTNSTLQALTA